MHQESSAGFLAACLTMPLCIAAGVLAYTPLGPDYIARGAVAGLSCAIVGGIVAALFRRSSFVVTFPTTPICVIQSSFVISLLSACAGDRLHTIAALVLCVALAGVWQALFAISGFSRFIRFVPHPVMAGFVSGVAALIAWHQVPALLGVHSLNDLMQSGLQLPHPLVTAFGVGLFVTILALAHYIPRVPHLLCGLLLGSLAFHLIKTFVPGLDIGATIGALPAKPLDIWGVLDWNTLTAIIGSLAVLKIVLIGSLTLALVATLDTFFALRTAQFIADVPIDPRRDVLGQAMGNIASALTGGLVVSTSLSVSMANYKAGGRTRISTIASGITLLISGIFFPRLIELLPIIVLAAILLAVSLRLVDRWSIQVLRQAVTTRDADLRHKARKDAAIILAVFLATLLGKPVTGVAVGIGISCILFMLDMSRPVIARKRDGACTSSKQIRTGLERDLLCSMGRSILVFDLEGVLFFGNAHGLANDLHSVKDEVEIIILDFRRISDIDSSGLTILCQVSARLKARNKKLLISGANPAWLGGPTAVAGGVLEHVFSSLDDALEWAEEHVITTSVIGEGCIPPAIGENEINHSRCFSDGITFLEDLSIVHYPAGSLLCKAGDPAVCMWILKCGSVSIHATGTHSSLVPARLGAGFSLGEMGLLDRQPRNADVYAEDDVEAYILTFEEFSSILAEKPLIGQSILAFINGQLARRLRDFNHICSCRVTSSI
jgi:MFS superfamily sulfate permease-like transporter